MSGPDEQTEGAEQATRGEGDAAGRRHPLFLPAVLVGGMIFGFGLGLSEMFKPEVVLSFLRLEDIGLLLVMGGASVVTGVVFAVASRTSHTAPLTGATFGRRLKQLDRNVTVGGVIFGVGWGISGICPGAAYASLGAGNLPILYGIAGMFIGAYLQGRWRTVFAQSVIPGKYSKT